MKRLLLITILFSSAAIAQDDRFMQINPQPNTTVQRIGTAQISSDGSMTQRIGNMQFQTPSGVSSQRVGNSQINSDGSSAQRIGNMEVHSNGVVCQQMGTMTVCN